MNFTQMDTNKRIIKIRIAEENTNSGLKSYKEKKMLEKVEKRKTLLDKKDDQLNKNLEVALKDQEVAKKMLQFVMNKRI